MLMAPIVLGPEEVDAALGGSAWRREGETIVCDCEQGNFVDTVGLLTAIAELAEAHNHHPDLLIHGYRHLRVTCSTHSAGGVTQLDLDLARAIDGLLAS